MRTFTYISPTHQASTFAARKVESLEFEILHFISKTPSTNIMMMGFHYAENYSNGSGDT